MNQSTKVQHTPTPRETALAAHEFSLADALLKADYAPWKIEEIIRTVNSHEELLASLKRFLLLNPTCHGGVISCGSCAVCEGERAVAKAEGQN